MMTKDVVENKARLAILFCVRSSRISGVWSTQKILCSTLRSTSTYEEVRVTLIRTQKLKLPDGLCSSSSKPVAQGKKCELNLSPSLTKC
eukprot:scaffold2141_cov120-Cylindrotheca_fusiformis.AAC.21